MNKLNLDMKTAKKIIANYSDKIKLYMKENKCLRQEISDLKTTLEINKSILYENLSKNGIEETVKKIKEENQRLNSLIEIGNKDKIVLEAKLFNLQEMISEGNTKLKEEIENLREKVFLYENKISEKENIIFILKRELEKYSNNDFISPKVILVGNPNMLNTELISELKESSELITKYTSLLQEEMKKSTNYQTQIKKLENYISDKKKCNKIAKNFENIDMLGYILTTSESNESSENSQENLESPIVKFSPRVLQKKTLHNEMKLTNNNVFNNTASSLTNVPRLNLKSVLSVYKPMRKGEIIEKKSTYKYDIEDEYIEKLKYQKEFYKDYALRYRKKSNDFKKIIEIFKQHYKNNPLNFELRNRSPLTKFSSSHMSTNEDSKINATKNTEKSDSMCPNITVLIEDEISKFDHSRDNNEKGFNNWLLEKFIEDKNYSLLNNSNSCKYKENQ